MRFYIVDAFTDQKFGGNPAGIIILEQGSSFPDDQLMIKTAAELRYSETAFIRQMAQKEFQIRYFTPVAEVELCGHATIAAFTALMERGLAQPGYDCCIHTLSGILNVELRDGFIMMDMASPKLVRRIDDPKDLRELHSIMGRSGEDDIFAACPDVDMGKLYPMIISTGLADIIMPVKNTEELLRLSPDFPALSALSQKYGVVGVHAFAIEGGDSMTAGGEKIDARCRNFAPLYGIDEEAATGTGNGGLMYYLYRHGLLPGGRICCFLQGEAIERPSKVYASIQTCSKEVKIKVGGSGVILASGTIDL